MRARSVSRGNKRRDESSSTSKPPHLPTPPQAPPPTALLESRAPPSPSTFNLPPAAAASTTPQSPPTLNDKIQALIPSSPMRPRSCEWGSTVLFKGLQMAQGERETFLPIFTFKGLLQSGHYGVVGVRVDYQFKTGSIARFTGMAWILFSSEDLANLAIQFFHRTSNPSGHGYIQAEQARNMLQPTASSGDAHAGASRFNADVWDFPDSRIEV